MFLKFLRKLFGIIGIKDKRNFTNYVPILNSVAGIKKFVETTEKLKKMADASIFGEAPSIK